MPYSQPGTKNGRARLTAEQVRIMRADWIPNRITARQLRDKYAPDVPLPTVQQALNGRTWRI